jgi:hypothetical protein
MCILLKIITSQSRTVWSRENWRSASLQTLQQVYHRTTSSYKEYVINPISFSSSTDYPKPKINFDVMSLLDAR